MENIHFTDEAIAGLVTQSILMMILPIVLLIIWKIKTKESIIPVVVGAVTWFLFAIVLKLAPAYLLLYANNQAAETIRNSVLLTAILSGVLAGVFEETGRFLAFKTAMKKYEHRRSSISYGIGHGGFESAYVGFQMFTMALMGIMINSGMGDQLTANVPEAQIPTMFSQLNGMSQLTFGECMLGIFERIPALVSHISFSVLVFSAARNKKYIYLYPLAIVIHAFVDFTAVIISSYNMNVWLIELIIAVIAVILAFFTTKVYKKLPE